MGANFTDNPDGRAGGVSDNYIFGDAHTHLDQYAPEELTGILQRAGEAGIGFIVCAGTTLDSTRACIRMTEEHGVFYAGVGIHPMEAHQPIDETIYRELESLARDNPKVVCISEVGLDFMPTSSDWTLCPPRRTTRCKTRCSGSRFAWRAALNCLLSSIPGSPTRRFFVPCGRRAPTRWAE